jgi:hypothetical protein
MRTLVIRPASFNREMALVLGVIVAAYVGYRYGESLPRVDRDKGCFFCPFEKSTY